MHATIMKRLARRAAAVVAAAGLFALTPPATAGPCGSREQIIKELARTYKERPAAIGLMGTGEALEIFVSEAGTWTAIVSRPGGLACIVASGEVWMFVPRPGPEV